MSDIIRDKKKFEKGWVGGLPETPCGFGSKISETVRQREWIPTLIEKYQIRTIADIGAGDLNWVQYMDLKGARYTPYDLVPRRPEVIEFDITRHVPTRVDLLMVFWVLNHLDIPKCRQAIRNIQASGSKYLLLTQRQRYKEDQPEELDEIPYIEEMILNEKLDSIRLIEVASI